MKKYLISILAGAIVFVVVWQLLTNVSQEKYLDVDLKIVVLKDDLFQIFYVTDSVPTFLETHSIRKEVNGRKGIQRLRFQLPLKNGINQIRINLGHNRVQDPMEIDKVILTVGKNQIKLKKLNEKFSMNQFVTFRDNKFHTKVIDDRYDPYLVSEPLNNQMRRLQKSSFEIWSIIIAMVIASAICLFCLQIIEESQDPILWPAWAFSLLFVGISFLPLIADSKDESDSEKRELIKKPKFEISENFTSDFEKYFSDNFGFRATLINWSSKIKITLFRSSPRPQDVMFGKSNFLFYNKELIYNYYSNSNLLNTEELKTLTNKLKTRREELEKEGIPIIYSYWPNKSSIYPEMMPTAMSIQRRGNTSRADQLVRKLESENEIFIDVKQDLIAAKSEQQVYRKLDTHWNEYGAYIAYRSFFEQAYPELGIKPYPLDSFDLSSKKKVTGDLVTMLAMDSIQGYLDINPSLGLKKTKLIILPAKEYPAGTVLIQNPKSTSRKRLLIFGDSFTNHLQNYFPLHFYEVIIVRFPYDKKIVDQAQPDLVISCPVERFLSNL